MRRLLVLLLLMPSAARAQVALDVPGHAPAVVVVPSGDAPRPVVIVLHGNYDRPEWACASWMEIVQGRAFILCPRGVRRRGVPASEDRWTYRGGADAVMEEIRAARAALVAREGDRVMAGPDVYAGFSLGAHLVAELASRPHGPRRIQLVEGGRALLDRSDTRRRFARAGGRLAIVCGQRSCDERARVAAAAIEREGGEATTRFVEVGHTRDERMTPLMRETFDWLVRDDPRFH